jgi:hypothetical protein
MRFRLLLALLTALQLCTPAAAQQRCLFFSGTADAFRKSRATEDSLVSLREAIDKWKAENGVTAPVTETAQKPNPHPYWRSAVSPDLFLPPDLVSETAYTVCWKGVVSPVVCTSGSKVCW